MQFCLHGLSPVLDTLYNIGQNHTQDPTQIGQGVSLVGQGAWHAPLGRAPLGICAPLSLLTLSQLRTPLRGRGIGVGWESLGQLKLCLLLLVGVLFEVGLD